MSNLLANIDATCVSLGYKEGDNYQIENETIEKLKHLIGVLKRDTENHDYRKHIGNAKVLQTDLIHMVPGYMDDDAFADALIRLLLTLTSPTLLLYPYGLPKDKQGQRTLLELGHILRQYKTAFVSEKVWVTLYNKLRNVLNIDWTIRNKNQNLLMQRILELIRNVLQIPSHFEIDYEMENSASVHDEIIWSLTKSGIMDLILIIVSQSDEKFHFLCLEILSLIYREQTAESLADLKGRRTFTQKQDDVQQLIAARNREKEMRALRPISSRHSRFGGTFVIKNCKSASERDMICHQPLQQAVSMDFDRQKFRSLPSNEIEESRPIDRKSTYAVRLFLYEYSTEILRGAYNNFVRQSMLVFESNIGLYNENESYLMWAIKFYMEFNRLIGMKFEFVSGSLNMQCFNWILTRIKYFMHETTKTYDENKARLWLKRLHLALQVFRELLSSLILLRTLTIENARELFSFLIKKICYVTEYRETILDLLINFNEQLRTKFFLRDVIETTHIFTKIMKKFCEDNCLVLTVRKVTHNKPKRANTKAKEDISEEVLNNKWVCMSAEISVLLSSIINKDGKENITPFDITLEQTVDEQKENCMMNILTHLRKYRFEEAVLLLRAAREVWSEDNAFGSSSATPEDELILLRNIFVSNIKSNVIQDDKREEEDDSKDSVEEPEYEKIETTLKFKDFTKRFLNPKVVKSCTLVLVDWKEIPQKYIKAAVTILHHIAVLWASPAMLYQAQLFRIFQQVFEASADVRNEELQRLGTFVIRKFIANCSSNKKIYAELLFYKTIEEAKQIESGYYDDSKKKAESTWSKEQNSKSKSSKKTYDQSDTVENVFPKKLKTCKNESDLRKQKKQASFNKNKVFDVMCKIDVQKYQSAIDWLAKSLEDAASEVNDCSKENAVISLVPLGTNIKDAMEDDDFKELLLSLSLSPPISGMQIYWRVPICLSSAELQMRANILSKKIDTNQCINEKDICEDRQENEDDENATNNIKEGEREFGGQTDNVEVEKNYNNH